MLSGAILVEAMPAAVPGSGRDLALLQLVAVMPAVAMARSACCDRQRCRAGDDPCRSSREGTVSGGWRKEPVDVKSGEYVGRSLSRQGNWSISTTSVCFSALQRVMSLDREGGSRDMLC